ncbi:ATP-binding protein [Geobacter anodireducens]
MVVDTTVIDAQRRLERLRSERQIMAPRELTPVADLQPVVVERDEEEGGVCAKHGLSMRIVTFAGHRAEICEQCIDEEAREEVRRQMAVKRGQSLLQDEVNTSAFFDRLQVGHRYRDIGWDDFREVNAGAREAKNTCRTFADNFPAIIGEGTNLVLHGGVGTGKTMLASLVVRTVAEFGFSALHTKAVKLFRRVKETYGPASTEKTSDAIAAFVSPDLLVIDELGVQRYSEDEALILNELIDDRHDFGRPTILVTNLGLDELKALLGPRVYSRIFSGNSKAVHFWWYDFRTGDSPRPKEVK